ncbi:hypothetical protein Vadar_030941 [Vaccinium darrowii]|nr:hypothetical protein Vadar_030941 [Vaccinium darrowii]
MNQPTDRGISWHELRGLHRALSDEPWILLGNFNAVRRVNERSTIDNFDFNAATDFNSCIEDIEVDDIPAKGFWFSCSNRSGGMGQNKSRIDRVMVNQVWQDVFTESEAVFAAPGIFDHCSLIVSVLPYKPKRKPFKFFNYWMSDPKFPNLLKEAWSQTGGYHPMERLSLKLQVLKGLLKDLNKSVYGNISIRTAEAKSKLIQIQEEATFGSVDDDVLAQEGEAMLVYRHCHALEI